MGVREELEKDLREAMRAHESDRLSAIRMLRAAIQNAEIARTDPKHPKHGEAMSEADYLAAVDHEVKQRREAREFAERAGRDDLVHNENVALAIMERYLPRQLSREEVEAEVRALLPEVGSDFRKLMPVAAQRLRGRADGRMVSEVVRALTGG